MAASGGLTLFANRPDRCRHCRNVPRRL